jgi:hypothetical protein
MLVNAEIVYVKCLDVGYAGVVQALFEHAESISLYALHCIGDKNRTAVVRYQFSKSFGSIFGSLRLKKIRSALMMHIADLPQQFA